MSAAEGASEASSPEQANERANERVAQYLRLYSRWFHTTVRCWDREETPKANAAIVGSRDENVESWIVFDVEDDAIVT